MDENKKKNKQIINKYENKVNQLNDNLKISSNKIEEQNNQIINLNLVNNQLNSNYDDQLLSESGKEINNFISKLETERVLYNKNLTILKKIIKK